MKHTLITALAVALLAGCGDDNMDQQEAREQATEHTCDRAEACDLVGSGKTYTDRDDCEVKVSNAWNNQWSKAECDGQVSSADLDLCLGAIDVTLCNNFEVGVAALALVGQCQQQLVCSAE